MKHKIKLFTSLPALEVNLSLLLVLLGMSLVSTPVQAQSFFFQDDFNRTQLGPSWDVDLCGAGTVQIVSGRLHIFSPPPGNLTCTFNQVRAMLNSPDLTDVTIEFDFDGGPLVGSNNVAFMFARFTSFSSYYAVFFNRDVRNCPVTSERRRVEIVSPSKGILARALDTNLTPGRYQFSVIGNQLTFKNVGGTGTPINLTVTDSDPSLVSGLVGFGTNEAPQVFFDNVTIEGNTGVVEVAVDIKPGSDPNSWDCNDVNNDLPVAILSDANFDATTVDANSVRFGKTGSAAAEVHKKNGQAKRHEEDVNKDGLKDMVFHFRFGDTGFSCDDIPVGQKSATLPAQLTGSANGTAIEGTDVIRLVNDKLSKAVAGTEDTKSVPEGHTLFQNHPNPFNPETDIHFQLPEASHVVVRIFNLLGREIRTLTDIHYEAGYHTIRWDSKDNNGNAVSSGIYLYQLQAGSFSQIRKMTLLR